MVPSTLAGARSGAGRACRMAVLVVCAASCRSKPGTGAGGPPADSANAVGSAALVAGGCRDFAAAPLILGRATTRPLAGQDEDSDLELPFSVELGTAHAGPGQIAVGGIESRGGANHAFVALMDEVTGAGKSVELGRVFGDVEPPALVARGQSWLIAVADSDAAGGVLKLSSLSSAFTSQVLERGAELTGVRRDSSGFALEASGAGALLAWTKLDKGKAKLVVAAVEPTTAALQGSPLLLASSSFGDPEAPRLVARPSGYFLTYIVRGASREHPLRSDAGAEQSESWLDDAPSAIEIVPLDASGVPLSAARRLTAAAARVLAFDVLSTPEGGALVVYRNEPRGPGLDPPQLQVVSVRADGTFAEQSWELGASIGLPSLLRDPRPRKGGPWAYIGLASEQGTRLGVLASDPLATPEFLGDAGLGEAELLGALAGRILRARARGTQRELALIECPLPARASAR